MSGKVTSYVYSDEVRYTALGLAAVGTAALLALGLVDALRVQLGGGGVCFATLFAATTSFAGIFVHLERQAMTVSLVNLEVEARERALTLAWRSPPMGGANVLRWGATSIGLATLLILAVPPTSSALGVVVLLAAAITPATVAMLFALGVATPFLVDVALRRAGASFVHAHVGEWTEAARGKCGDLGLDRFQLKDPSTLPYVLWEADAGSAEAADMPARRLDFTVLVVGEFVGFHLGYVLDLKGVSLLHAAETDPDVVVRNHVRILENPAIEQEREAHYHDIVNIDYHCTDSSAGEAVGLLRLGLSNGEKIEYATLREGPPWKAALENIRSRTREVKLAGTRALG